MDVAVDSGGESPDHGSPVSSGDQPLVWTHNENTAHLQHEKSRESDGRTQQTGWRRVRGMQVGWRIAVVCAVAFCINCQPSEPYLTQYLQEDKNLTEAQLDTVVWPAELYANLAFLLPVGFAAEQLGYVPIVFFGLISREATRVVLIFSRSLSMMVLTQVTYAVASVANSVLLSYLYLVIPPPAFVTGSLLFKACYTGGNVVGSALGQLLYDHTDISLKGLFYASWAFTSAGFLIFTFARPRQLPRIPGPDSPSTDPPGAHVLQMRGSRARPWDEPGVSCAESSDVRLGGAQNSRGASQHAGAAPLAQHSQFAHEPLVLIMDYGERREGHRQTGRCTQGRGIAPRPCHDDSSCSTDKSGATKIGKVPRNMQRALEEEEQEQQEEEGEWKEEEEEAPLLLHEDNRSSGLDERHGGAGDVNCGAQDDGSGAMAVWVWIKHQAWRYKQLYTHRLVVLWSLWWVFAFGSNVLFGNYYQTLLYNHYDHVPFGWIECGIEVGGTIGNLVQVGVAHHYIHSSLSPPVSAICLVAAAALSQVLWPQLAVTATVYCLFSAVFKGTLGLASAGIAAHMSERRFALVFTTNSFFSLALATAVSAVASALSLDTLGYFRIIMGMTLVGLLTIAARIACYHNRCSHDSR